MSRNDLVIKRENATYKEKRKIIDFGTGLELEFIQYSKFSDVGSYLKLCGQVVMGVGHNLPPG
jgi:hypothetical protein